MKRSTVILLVCIFAIRSTFPLIDLSDIAELPELLSHYRSHTLANRQVSFLEFIHLHYNQDSGHWKDDLKHHQKLPFSKRSSYTFSPQMLTDVSKVIDGFPFFQLLNRLDDRRTVDLFSYQLIKTVWQPPRA